LPLPGHLRPRTNLPIDFPGQKTRAIPIGQDNNTPMKPTISKSLLLLLAALVSLFATGCTYVDDGQSNVPWARPAEFQNNLPGLGGL
jgi:hypothetical protein